jgi:hypothetical protein
MAADVVRKQKKLLHVFFVFVFGCFHPACQARHLARCWLAIHGARLVVLVRDNALPHP